MREIIVPDTKPATEWVAGRALQKVSPQERHARTQLRLGAALADWAARSGLGRVGTEWEFRVTPPGEATRPLVPDIAYLSFDRVGPNDDEKAQIPYVAPDVAIEILSPDDRRADVEHKISVYLRSGTALVVTVDPSQQTFALHDADGRRLLGAQDIFAHAALPGLAVKVADVFARFKPRGKTEAAQP